MLRLKLLCGMFLLLWAPVRAGEPIQAFCDDKDVESAVDVALVEHNKNLQLGNQFALYQIVSAKKEGNESGTVFSVDFQARESDCPVGGDKTWKDCNYLPIQTPSLCEAKVYRSNNEGNQEVLLIMCVARAEESIDAKYMPCLGCPEVINTASEDLKEPLAYSVAKFNMGNNSTHHFVLNEVRSATRQVVAGFRYDLQFDMAKSNCSKTDFSELTDECHRNKEDREFSHCNSTVYVAPWRREEPETHINCAPGLHANIFLKRRPPGWSPLRKVPSMELVAPPCTAPAPGPSKNATEDSSEESQERATPTNCKPVPPSESISTFNCPSKPWKSYVPAVVPPETSPEPSPEDGDLTDIDLL
ncbi:kininogen-1 [Brienomyrus brachyistius]|uniref:kininogen-1 n=1 Tax=Brienomyrus brachyistius TaxID=42636 RepID=UPI0020B2A94E|nr:kininogen-1 [Brienomyrus brachyistius]